MEQVEETPYPSYEELAARVAAMEQAVATEQARGAIDRQRVNTPPTELPVRNWWANAMELKREEKRVARVRQQEAQREAERVQAIKDAPKRAKRDKVLAALAEQRRVIQSERETLDERDRRLATDWVQLNRSPL